ncbi:hypothetical protein DSCA_17530 [Desulfosarcina alkanivorans]|uniref:Signal transduction histidine kinase dimerisation/phosphoacceptor domain-containing protein n=1 Tax=Desulfosarcina alkanivorans TaxID=571177 RepID=A0A5K7YGY6_9BACT|nr:hypothetical protein [Desulfosarcina alkanivorans]BBO67823.1 hypothetical protein DSCA_17530 [Desulfosarcina alkanivorans]
MNTDQSLINTRFREGVEDRSVLKPFRSAMVVSLTYVVLLFLYIYISGKIALQVSASAEILRQIELLKGFVFAVVTGTLLFLCIFTTAKKISKQDDLIIAQNKSITVSERLVMAGLFSSSVYHDINNIMVVATLYTDCHDRLKSNSRLCKHLVSLFLGRHMP